MIKGDKVHVATKQHETFDNAEVVFDDGVTLIVETVDGSKLQFKERHELPWSDIMYCEEQAQWDDRVQMEKEVQSEADEKEDE